MRLHEHTNDFKDLQELTAEYIGIPTVAVERDYYCLQRWYIFEQVLPRLH